MIKENIIKTIVAIYEYIAYYLNITCIVLIRTILRLFTEYMFSYCEHAGIDNIQLDTVNITNRGKFVLGKIWDKSLNGFNIRDFVQYFSMCSIIYIDFRKDGMRKQKKILLSKGDYKYVDSNNNTYPIDFNLVKL